MKSILITGCNRGIGLGLVKQFVSLTSPPERIIATCRDTHQAVELVHISQQHQNIHIVNVDLTDFNSYKDFAKTVAEITKDEGLNVLINNAGVSTKFTRVQQVKVQQMLDNYVINTVAPLMLTKHLLPFLKIAADRNKTAIGVARAAVINMTSVLGSIQGNVDGGFYPYRSSKAALNAVTKSLSVDLCKDGITVVSLHPGWVKTDMGGKNAPMDVTSATQQIVTTLGKIAMKDSGHFIQYDGQAIPW